jgi:hypothetical protein
VSYVDKFRQVTNGRVANDDLRRDGLIGLTCADDLNAWIARRRQLPDAVMAQTGLHQHTGENLGKL